MKKIVKIKSIICILILSVSSLFLLSSCSSCNNNDSTPPETHVCAKCNKTTTDFKSYKNNAGTELYYCKECRETCAVCGGEATKHYTNALDQIVFVCKDCYKENDDD